MNRVGGVVAVALALAGAALVGHVAVAHAADRPNEDEMFGSAPAKPAAPAGTAPGAPGPDGGAPGGDGGAVAAPADGAAAPPAGPVSLQPEPSSPGQAGGQMPSRDDSLMGDPNGATKLSAETAPEDPLKIGGQLYLRAFARASKGQAPGDYGVTAPSLIDGYFDARPNERVRGFVLGRLAFDPTLPSTMAAPSVAMDGMTGTPAVPLLSGVQNTRGPSAILDQLWIRFDIKRVLFVTAGRQHVKWGTGRFWTPTDFLHPVPRNPVAAFDARPGFTMLKLHLPWEERGWNFYAFVLAEGVRQISKDTGAPIAGSDGPRTLGQLGAAVRAEVVVGTSEWGLGGVFYRDQKPRLGGDVSFGVGDFDLYVDAGFRFGKDLVLRSYVDGTSQMGLTDEAWIRQTYPSVYPTGIKPQVTAGGVYSLRYNDNDVFTVTGEYFYNSRGYDDIRVYPGLFLTQTFDFFYVGRHYAALGAIAAAPFSWNYTTFSLSTLGNLSDMSFMTILNYSLTMLTHLRFEAFGAVNYGQVGEFRLRFDGVTLPSGQSIPAIPPPSFSVGLGLRIAI